MAFMNLIAYAIILTLTTHLLCKSHSVYPPIASIIGMMVVTICFILADSKTVKQIYQRLHLLVDSVGITTISQRSSIVHSVLVIWITIIQVATYVISDAFKSTYGLMLFANLCVLAIVNIDAFRNEQSYGKVV